MSGWEEGREEGGAGTVAVACSVPEAGAGGGESWEKGSASRAVPVGGRVDGDQ